MYRLVLLSFILMMSGVQLGAYAFQEASIEYYVPIDFSVLDKNGLAYEANKCYMEILNMPDSPEKIEKMESAKRHFKILNDIYPDSIDYCLKLAIIYDLAGEDRYAKGLYFKALSMKRNNAHPYYLFGNFYYKRENYRKALKLYNRAYELGFYNHYFTLKNMAVIYEKFGDTRCALEFYKRLQTITPNDEELNTKIRLLEDLNSGNLLYYQNSRIRNQS